MGHSFGASLALAYALRFPDRVRAVVYQSGTGVDPSWHGEYRRNRLARMTDADRARFLLLRDRRHLLDGPERESADREYGDLSALTDFGDPDRAHALRTALAEEELPPNLEVNSVLGAEAAALTEDGRMAARLPPVTIPVLVVHGAADPRPWRPVRDMARLLPHARFVLLEGVGHFPWPEAPGELERELHRFLQGQLSS